MSMIRITSRQNEIVKRAFVLKKNPDKHFLIEGFHLVEEAYKNNLLDEVFSLEEIKLDNVKTYLVTKQIIEKLASSKSPQGIVGVCHIKKPLPLSSNHVLVLDRIQDPGNLGTLLRSALCFCFKDIVILEGSSSPYSEKALMAGQGSLFSLNIIVSKKEELTKLLKGYTIFSTCLQNAKSIDEMPTLPDKLALILGNEGQGVCNDLLDISDDKIKVEMENFDSLNVAIAGSILMHQIFTLGN